MVKISCSKCDTKILVDEADFYTQCEDCETEPSLSDEVQSVITRATRLAYESNPSRIGWPEHTLDCEFEIINEAVKNPDEYYLIALYLDSDNQAELFNIVEGLPLWVDTFLSGRCSLNDLVSKYTPEALQLKIAKARETLDKIEALRLDFIKCAGNEVGQ